MTVRAAVRWSATLLYATAIIGALVVPHAHRCESDSCCTGQTCQAEEHDCHDHHHHHDEHADHSHEPAPEAPQPAPFDPDCPLCRFLAQPVQIITAPEVIEAVELSIPHRNGSAASPDLVAFFRRAARGPPAC